MAFPSFYLQHFLKESCGKKIQSVYLVYFLYLDMLNWELEKSAYH